MPSLCFVKFKRIPQQEPSLRSSFVLFFWSLRQKFNMYQVYLRTPRKYRQKIVRLSSAQSGLIMNLPRIFIFALFFSSYFCMSAELVWHRRLIWFSVWFFPKVLNLLENFAVLIRFLIMRSLLATEEFVCLNLISKLGSWLFWLSWYLLIAWFRMFCTFR